MEKKIPLTEFAKLHGVDYKTVWNWLRKDKDAAKSQGERVSFYRSEYI